jgi:hypothetical protein
MKGRSSVVGIRLTAEEVAKLDRLAGRTFRGRGDVVRFILAHTQEAELGGLTFDPEGVAATVGSDN